MAKESGLWGWLRDNAPSQRISFLRIESGTTEAGLADVHYTMGSESITDPYAICGWIELKSVPLPRRAGTKVLGNKRGLSPEQRNFHFRNWRLGARSWIFIQANNYKWLVSARFADQVNGLTVDDLTRISSMWRKGNWTPQTWEDFFATLKGRI